MSETEPRIKPNVILYRTPPKEGTLWFFYAAARATFISEHGNLYEAQPDPILRTFGEEVAGRWMLGHSCENALKQGEQLASAYLADLLKVFQADFISEYVWLFLAQPNWLPDQRPPKMPAFLGWAMQNLLQHKVETLSD